MPNACSTCVGCELGNEVADFLIMNKVAPEQRESPTYIDYLRKLWGIKNGEARQELADTEPAPTDIYAAKDRKGRAPRRRTDWPY